MSEKKHDEWLNRQAHKFKYDGANVRYVARESRQREQLLTEWYGSKLALQELAAHRSEAKSLSDIVPSLVKELKLEDESIYALIYAAWPDIAGSVLKNRIFPARVDKTCLIIEASDSATLYHFTTDKIMEGILLNKINAVCDNKIGSLRFVHRGRA